MWRLKKSINPFFLMLIEVAAATGKRPPNDQFCACFFMAAKTFFASKQLFFSFMRL